MSRVNWVMGRDDWALKGHWAGMRYPYSLGRVRVRAMMMGRVLETGLNCSLRGYGGSWRIAGKKLGAVRPFVNKDEVRLTSGQMVLPRPSRLQKGKKGQRCMSGIRVKMLLPSVFT